MTDHTRIAELESVLKDTVAYLNSLPMHPATREIANKADAVLKKKYTSILQAGIRYAHGALIVGAQLDGMKLTLKTEKQAFPSDVLHTLEAGLQARFTRGLCLEMKHLSGQFESGFFNVETFQRTS
jgi:hypothetical protein